jgi:hypothetical protein
MIKYTVHIIIIMVLILGMNAGGYPQDFLPAQNPLEENEWVASADIPPKVRNLIIEKIAALPEYKNTDDIIRKSAKGKRGVAAVIRKDQSGYTVRIGRGGAKFETYYLFHVDADTYLIMIYDFLSDRYVTPEEWRRRETINEIIE